jgi:pimeloyl-ACP methyl ester carboxylesterase
MSQQMNDNAIGFLEIDKDIAIRRMVLRNPKPKGTVLFLHGFPETLYAWKDISLAARFAKFPRPAGRCRRRARCP